MPDAANPPKTIIFLHIPKAAGTSLKRILDKNYCPGEIYFLHNEENQEESEEEFKRLPDAEKQRYRLIYGHQYFGLHACLPQTAAYLSILRDPVERAISHYYFVRNVAHNPLHHRAMQVTLEDYIVHEIAGKELDNGQTRRLAGVRSEVDCDAAMFELAKTNIENHFHVIGLSERFDETLFLVKQVLKLAHTHYRHMNRTPHPNQEQVSPAIVNLIKERNQYDLMLYDYVENRLDRQLHEQSPAFQRSLWVFKAMNWFYGVPYEIIQFTKRRILNPAR